MVGAEKTAVARGRIEDAINTNSRPTELRITDMRLAVVAANYDYPILRIDTNQGVYGIGEVRDAGHAENALQFKSMLLGQNPCNIDMIFRTIKRFGNWGREGGGVSGIEIALMDLIGKIYGVPCYQLLGGKYRDKVRLYGDTPTPDNPTPEDFVRAVKSRRDRGLTFIKFDLRPSLFETGENPLIGHDARFDFGSERGQRFRAPMAGRGVKLTEKSIEAAAEVVATVRQAVGKGIQLCVDHFGEGYLTSDEVIRLGKALEKYDLAWMEDPVSRFDIPGHKHVADALLTPIAAGEDWYLREGFREAIRTRAVDIVHPDLLTSGGSDGDQAHFRRCRGRRHSDRVALRRLAHRLHGQHPHRRSDLELRRVRASRPRPAVLGRSRDRARSRHTWRTATSRCRRGPGLASTSISRRIEANLRTPGTMFLPTDDWNTPKLGFWRPDNRWPE